MKVLKTMNVLSRAREHLNCNSLSGVPIVYASYGSGVNFYGPFLYEDVLTSYVGIEGG